MNAYTNDTHKIIEIVQTVMENMSGNSNFQIVSQKFRQIGLNSISI